MLEKYAIENILFLDIETVPEAATFSDLDEIKQELFAHKTAYQRKEDITAEAFYDRAGIWAEFGKIICISVGYFTYKNGERQFRTTSFHGDEKNYYKNFQTYSTVISIIRNNFYADIMPKNLIFRLLPAVWLSMI